MRTLIPWICPALDTPLKIDLHLNSLHQACTAVKFILCKNHSSEFMFFSKIKKVLIFFHGAHFAAPVQPLHQPFYGYPFQHQSVRYLDPSAAYFVPQQQLAFRGISPHGPLLPPSNIGLHQRPLFPGEAVLNSFLANIPPVFHQSFAQNFMQNVIAMHATVAETEKNFPPPYFEPRK